MKVLVDTPVWSYALRSHKAGFERHVDALKELIMEQRVAIIGPIRQEILSGYSDLKKFERLNEKLAAFKNTAIIDDDYIQAALFSNQCRQNGIQCPHVDFLIYAVAVRMDAEILTSDKDFEGYQKHLPIKLFALI